MNPITISVIPGVKVDLLEYSIANVEPLEDFSLIVLRTTVDGKRWRQEFWANNSALPLSAGKMLQLRQQFRDKLESKKAQEKISK